MSTEDRPPLPDQPARDRFQLELDRNFSVTAPAGVGKTTAIVNRVIQLARLDAQRAEPALPRLTVVTYTRKAADEMRRRSAEALHEAEAGPEVFAQFHQAYFGTIHSFCLELLRQYGALAGLAPQVEQATNEDALWWEFLRGHDNILGCLPAEVRGPFTRLAQAHKIYGLAREIGASIPKVDLPGTLPKPDLSPILDFKPPNKRGLAGIQEGQRLASEWQTAFEEEDSPCPLPDHEGGSAEFKEIWPQPWAPLKAWLSEVSLYLAARLAQEFRAFRVQRGQINYDDMVALANDLLQDPVAGSAIRADKRIVILDEAQDTDRLQFALLLNVAGAQWDASAPLSFSSGPLPGRFCMVGDPQQAIYSSRAELATYREIHESLVANGAAEELEFTVTMRCDSAIVDGVNQFFPNILRPTPGRADQAAFVPLTARPNAGPGRVERLRLTPDADWLGDKPKTFEWTNAEARALARWLRETGYRGLEEEDWREVAILSPRKRDWLEALINALDRESLPWQAHSGRGNRADDPVWAWTAAVVHVMAFPEDDFELAGVLREVFALPDDAIARQVFASRALVDYREISSKSRFRDNESVNDALALLTSVREAIQEESLSDAFQLIVDRLQLGSRLAALPDQSAAQVDLSLKRLMNNAIATEEQGGDLAEWSNRLILGLAGDPEGDDPAPGHIQLLTCHKAKGLQWGVVIAPFAYREIGAPPINYPCYFAETSEASALVANDKLDGSEALTRKKISSIRELERLAYVTWTRAQRRLILVDGAECFASNNRLAGSWIDHWKILDQGANAAAWEQLPAPRIEQVSKSIASVGGIGNQTGETPLFCRVEKACMGREPYDDHFPKRILPSSLANHVFDEADWRTGHARDEHDWRSEPGYQEVSAGAQALGGADYGNWWHHMAETGPWGHDSVAWLTHAESALLHCPDPERGRAEFQRLVATAPFQWLNQPERQVRPEAALLWPEAARICDQGELELPGSQMPAFVYDGFIDLLVHDEAKDAWRIVDWKTDRIKKDPAVELLAAYGPQIAAYVEALKGMFGRPVEGYLYSTRAAQWIKTP